ncbi:MAG: hypothetical protein EBU32_04895, partial [Opitutaceae bacterium]|nr:hypothetical protein [Opitutaceae bacterium]
MDGFVYRRVPYPAGVTEHRMKTAISKLHVPSIKTYITEMMRQMVAALAEGPPTLLAVPWIRARIGLSEEDLSLPAGIVRVDQLVDWLSTRG